MKRFNSIAESVARSLWLWLCLSVPEADAPSSPLQLHTFVGKERTKTRFEKIILQNWVIRCDKEWWAVEFAGGSIGNQLTITIIIIIVTLPN